MIGNAPEGWRVEKLWNIVNRMHQGINTAADKVEFDFHGYPIIQTRNITSGSLHFDNIKYINENDWQLYKDKYKPQKNDILLSNIGTIGKSIIIRKEEDFLIHWNIFLIEPILTFIFPDFLQYFFKKLDTENYYDRFLKGGTVKFISKGFLSDMTIPVPPLPQQEKIVKVLDISSALVEKQRLLMEKYDMFLKSKFIEMFGDPISNPFGWEVVKFGKVIETLTDYHANGSYETLKKHVELFDKKDYALMIRTTDLEKNNFNDGVKYISQHAYEFLTKSKVYGKEIIMNKIGSAGNIFLMPILNIPVSLGMNQFLIRVNKNSNSVFLYNFLETEYGKQNINKNVRGATTKSITKDAVREIEIYLPPITLQNKFAQIVEKIEQIKAKENKKLTHLQTLHNSLMDRAFKGEIK